MGFIFRHENYCKEKTDGDLFSYLLIIVEKVGGGY
jgi:hypothetical protein